MVFDITSTQPDFEMITITSLNIHDTYLYFYYNNSIIKLCSDLPDYMSKAYYIYLNLTCVTNEFRLDRTVKYNYKICPYFFRGQNIGNMIVENQMDSFIRKNLIQFDRVNATNSLNDLNIVKTKLYVKWSGYMVLDNRFLNEDLFK